MNKGRRNKQRFPKYFDRLLISDIDFEYLEKLDVEKELKLIKEKKSQLTSHFRQLIEHIQTNKRLKEAREKHLEIKKKMFEKKIGEAGNEKQN